MRRILCGILVLWLGTTTVTNAMTIESAEECEKINNSQYLLEFINESQCTQTNQGVYLFEKTQEVEEKDIYSNNVKEILVLFSTTDEGEKILQDTIKEAQKPYDSIYKSSGTGSFEAEDWDKYGIIQATLTVEYSRVTIDNVSYLKMTTISGTHSRASNGCSVKTDSVDYGSIGFYSDGYQNKNGEYIPTTSSWSFNAPSSWHAIENSGAISNHLGATYHLTISRGDSSWNMTVENHII